MPHILFLEALPTISGGQRVLLDLLPALSQEFEVTVVVPGPGSLATAVQQLGVSVVYLPIQAYGLVKKSWGDVAAFTLSTPRLSLALASLVRRLGVDLIYANSSPTFPWGTMGAFLASRPIIWHSHNILGDSKSLWLIRQLAAWPVVRQIIGASLGAIEQFGQVDKSTVITTGVDLSIFAPLPAERARLRSQLNIPLEAPVIGLMGDFIPLKRHHIFLQAALQAQTRIPDLRVLVVGAERPTAESHVYRSSLENWFKQSKVIVLSWQDQALTAVFNVLDILVVASTIETGPLVLFQGLACGTPVISTAVGHAPILLGQEFSPGVLFEIDQVTDLTRKLVCLLQATDQLKIMRRTARQIAEAKLDLHVAQQKIAVLVNYQLKR